MWFKKASARRQAIREDVAEAEGQGRRLKNKSGHLLLIALTFGLVAAAIQFWPGPLPITYREGEVAAADLRSPVTFNSVDKVEAERQREAARAASPPVLSQEPHALDQISNQLNAVWTNVRDEKGVSDVRARFHGLTDRALQAMQSLDEISYSRAVRTFVDRDLSYLPIVSEADRDQLREKHSNYVSLAATQPSDGRLIQQVLVVGNEGIQGVMEDAHGGAGGGTTIGVERSAEDSRKAAADEVLSAAKNEFSIPLAEFVTSYVMSLNQPTFYYDAKLSGELAERRAAQWLPYGPRVQQGEIIVKRGEPITPQSYMRLVEAQAALQELNSKDHPWALWLSRLGYLLTVLIITTAGGFYVKRMAQSSISAQRGWAVCGLLLFTLILAKAMATSLPPSVYVLSAAPTLLTAIILVIAYNPRFALGVSALHGLLVTVTLTQGIDFYLPLLAGCAAFCFGLSEIRTRGKLIEVGVVASAAIFVAVWALGLSRMVGVAWSPWPGSTDLHAIWIDSLWGLGAGVFVAMFALAILPTVERLFRITTAMTLLELCDANKPLLQRLSQEAAGTFNHSLTVGIMAEAAGNAIGANGLLCRVGAYYHDVGKLSKPQYFIENQRAGGPSRHDKLSPAMSLLIIVGHVKDGIELAREYGLPWIVHQFIAQHHGTTLVEYFFHAARERAEQADDGPGVSETEFRYPGPKPQTREAAIVMISDSCESVVRSIEEPTPGRIETAVHNMIIKRLMDGQFSQCDLTLRDLSLIEETLTRTLAGIHHGRVAYPTRAASDVGPSEMGISQPA